MGRLFACTAEKSRVYSYCKEKFSIWTGSYLSWQDVINPRTRKKGANIDDISQTILDEIFSMTMLVTLDPAVADFNAVQTALDGLAEELGVQIIIQREDLFQFMYKI